MRNKEGFHRSDVISGSSDLFADRFEGVFGFLACCCVAVQLALASFLAFLRRRMLYLHHDMLFGSPGRDTWIVLFAIIPML
jgi:hypothetical protein